jgi:putative transposase
MPVFFGDPARLGTEVAADGGGVPLLYLHGLSTSDFAPALEQFLDQPGLSAATITRLTQQWKDDARAFAARSLAEVDTV